MAGGGAAVTRREIGERLSRRLGLSARESSLLLEAFLEAVAEQLERGGAVTLSGLGRFAVRTTKPRPGRNPATGEAAPIPARIKPVFTISRSLRTLLRAEDRQNPMPRPNAGEANAPTTDRCAASEGSGRSPGRSDFL